MIKRCKQTTKKTCCPLPIIQYQKPKQVRINRDDAQHQNVNNAKCDDKMCEM